MSIKFTGEAFMRKNRGSTSIKVIDDAFRGMGISLKVKDNALRDIGISLWRTDSQAIVSDIIGP